VTTRTALAVLVLVLSIFVLGYEMGQRSPSCTYTHYEDGSSICVTTTDRR